MVPVVLDYAYACFTASRFALTHLLDIYQKYVVILIENNMWYLQRRGGVSCEEVVHLGRYV